MALRRRRGVDLLTAGSQPSVICKLEGGKCPVRGHSLPVYTSWEKKHPSEWERGKLIDMMPSSMGRRVVLNTCTILLCFAVGHDKGGCDGEKRK